MGYFIFMTPTGMTGSKILLNFLRIIQIPNFMFVVKGKKMTIYGTHGFLMVRDQEKRLKLFIQQFYWRI